MLPGGRCTFPPLQHTSCDETTRPRRHLLDCRNHLLPSVAGPRALWVALEEACAWGRLSWGLNFHGEPLHNKVAKQTGGPGGGGEQGSKPRCQQRKQL